MQPVIDFQQEHDAPWAGCQGFQAVGRQSAQACSFEGIERRIRRSAGKIGRRKAVGCERKFPDFLFADVCDDGDGNAGAGCEISDIGHNAIVISGESVLAAAVLAVIGNWNGLCLPKVREVRLVYPNLPRELEGYRIVQVSDLHASTAMRRWRTESIVKTVNALDADLICITGDLVDGEPEVAAEFVEPIRNFRAKDGVWVITGNHEYFYSVEKWRKCYDEWGIRFLENACVFSRKSLALGGVNDFQVCRGKFPKEWRPDVAAAFASATNGEFRVLLQHQPKDARENIVHHNVDLLLSGHTHGGFMPGIFTIISRASNGFIRGLYPIRGKFLFVSPGCGQCAWLPVRFFDPSELTVFVLERE